MEEVTFVTAGAFASMGSQHWEIAVVKGVLFPPVPLKVMLTGISLPPAKSVPPLVTVSWAVYVVLLDLTRFDNANPPMVEACNVKTSVLLFTVMVAVTRSPIFMAVLGMVTAVTAGGVRSTTMRVVLAPQPPLKDN